MRIAFFTGIILSVISAGCGANETNPLLSNIDAGGQDGALYCSPPPESSQPTMAVACFEAPTDPDMLQAVEMMLYQMDCTESAAPFTASDVTIFSDLNDLTARCPGELPGVAGAPLVADAEGNVTVKALTVNGNRRVVLSKPHKFKLDTLKWLSGASAQDIKKASAKGTDIMKALDTAATESKASKPGIAGQPTVKITD